MGKLDVGSSFNTVILVAERDPTKQDGYAITRAGDRSNRNPNIASVSDQSDWFMYMNEIGMVLELDGERLGLEIGDLSNSLGSFLRNRSPRYFLPGATFIRPFEVQDCAEMPESVRRLSRLGAWKGRNGGWSRYEEGDVALGSEQLVECPKCHTWVAAGDISTHNARYAGITKP